MGNVFRVSPVRVKRANGQVLTPDMEITITTQSYTSDPFYNGAKEIQEQYMRMYQFDYKKSNCSKYDFEFMKSVSLALPNKSVQPYRRGAHFCLQNLW